MSRRPNLPMPSRDFGLLLVEGGDEEAICRKLAGEVAWSALHCWKANGRDFQGMAALAKLDVNLRFARSVGIVLDAEGSPQESLRLATDALAILDLGVEVVGPGVLAGTPRIGAFLSPDGASVGAIETLCRRAVKDGKLARCVDELVACAGTPHAPRGNPRAAEDKGWLRAYLGMLSEPDLRLHQAFEHPHGVDAMHPAFDRLRQFVLAL